MALVILSRQCSFGSMLPDHQLVKLYVRMTACKMTRFLHIL